MAAAPGRKKKGLSLEEKVVLVERWIAAHPHPYTMKELQQCIPKQTPVIFQSVEECVQLLVSENRVEQDRVGVSTLFWHFPLTKTQKQNYAVRKGNGAGGMSGSGRRLTCADLLRRLSTPDTQLSSPPVVEQLCATIPAAELREWHATLLAECSNLQRRLVEEHARVGCSDNATDMDDEEARVKVEVASLDSLVAQRSRLVAEQNSLLAAQNLPEMLRQVSAAAAAAMEAANRWTDNYFLAEEEVVGRTGQSQRDVRTALQVPVNLDYVSDSDEDGEVGGDASEAAVVAAVVQEAASTPADISSTVTQTEPAPSLVHDATARVHETDAAAAGAATVSVTAETPAAAAEEERPITEIEAKRAPPPRKGKSGAAAPKKRTAQKRAR